MSVSKTRVGLIAPCVGVGGADALMLGLVQHAFNIEFTGLAVTRDVQPFQYEWMKKMVGNKLPLHVSKEFYSGLTNEITRHKSVGDCIYHACKNADVIMTWSVHELMDNWPNLDIPVITYSQNMDDYSKEVAIKNMPIAHYFAACSKMSADVYPEEVRKDVYIMYNAIDPARVAPRKGRETQRKVWMIKEENKVLLFMGRLVKEKRPQSLIQAICNLPEEWVGVYCGLGDEIDNLREQAENFCPGRIAFVEPQYHIGDILASADVFILPSDFEGMPLSVLEAWLAGVPTVVSDLPVYDELEQMHGPLTTKIPIVPTTEDIVQGILRASSDEVVGQTANARHTVWNNYTLPTLAYQWETLFDNVVFDYRQRKRMTQIHPATHSRRFTHAGLLR